VDFKLEARDKRQDSRLNIKAPHLFLRGGGFSFVKRKDGGVPFLFNLNSWQKILVK
jgi:hypothetical protein